MGMLPGPSSRTAVGLAAGIASVSALALFVHLQLRRKRDETFDDEEDDTPVIEFVKGAAAGSDEAHSLKSRIGNFKASKLVRLVEDLATELGHDVRLRPPAADDGALSDGGEEDIQAVATAEQLQTAEESQIAFEERTLREAIDLLRLVRQSSVPKKLPHFYVVDRQLEQAARQLDEVLDNVSGFWRYGREDPTADLFALPFMQLAAHGGIEAMVPMPEDAADGPATSSEAAEWLGIAADAGRREAELAFRTMARKLHRHGECIDRDAFHKLTEAYEVYNSQRGVLPYSVGSQGADVLAHYLLVGTDPRGSRYREYARGLLDAPSRERLLQKVAVLLNWGEAAGSMTGLGQG